MTFDQIFWTIAVSIVLLAITLGALYSIIRAAVLSALREHAKELDTRDKS